MSCCTLWQIQGRPVISPACPRELEIPDWQIREYCCIFGIPEARGFVLVCIRLSNLFMYPYADLSLWSWPTTDGAFWMHVALFWLQLIDAFHKVQMGQKWQEKGGKLMSDVRVRRREAAPLCEHVWKNEPWEPHPHWMKATQSCFARVEKLYIHKCCFNVLSSKEIHKM